MLEEKLNAAGIDRYRQIAVLTDADIDHLESEVIHLSGRIRRDDWIGQARALHCAGSTANRSRDCRWDDRGTIRASGMNRTAATS
ncbi:MAG: hypothetical protein U5O69_07100 [Candidatus Competibacteraceae bacterium]|nr:hypothetical protein [Candidatus Competibacteraceae bacterium]